MSILEGESMKCLNLYAGLGGNRRLWEGVSVTAVERDEDIAEVYHRLYPKDTIVVGDAHEYLLNNFEEFDFIWSSPPCQSHSSFRQNIGVRFRGVNPVYPDLSLYQEIIFLKSNCNKKWVVENVKPYYDPLIKNRYELHRHLIWSNFFIPFVKFESHNLRVIQIDELQKIHGIDLSQYKISNKRQLLRNCVDSHLGLHILNSAKGDLCQKKTKQLTIF